MSDEHPFGPIDPREAVTVPDFDPCAGYTPRGRYVRGVTGGWHRLDTLAKQEQARMPSINDAFPSNYLKASDIKGVEPVVAIDRVAFEPVGRQRDMKAILYFKGKEKGLVLNKTNATKITQLAGTNMTESWDGLRIKLYATETEYAGDTVECIRIKAAPANSARPVAPPPPPPVEHDDITDSDIPF